MNSHSCWLNAAHNCINSIANFRYKTFEFAYMQEAGLLHTNIDETAERCDIRYGATHLGAFTQIRYFQNALFEQRFFIEIGAIIAE